ncbi:MULTISPECIES: flagellar filament capping protein FliD [Clostridium]|uniref:Flagellar hook-associated protein 2 n=1 Tax=Clostridium frigoriphilum TaxID=443253 RepID=A0ABU7UJI0_9CLOT|nr:flagellar filament capping protein FliD [Clostridium sp. DSM 17811]MBU3098607.1 flagellar filament capping protein FliD [Clostridium sp. DSM 17811]
MTSIYPSSTNTTSSTSSANLLKISGMASGIDTDAVVKAMVSNYQTKIDKANQAKQTLAWQQEAYRDVIKDIKGLQDYFDPLSSKYMLSDNSMNTNLINSTEPSIVSGTVSASAKAGTYAINVQKLAAQAQIEGTSQNSIIKVADLANWSGTSLNFQVNADAAPVSIKLSDISSGTATNSTSMATMAADINKQISASALNGKISASYVSNGADSYIKFTKSSTNTDSITLNGKDSTVVTSDLTINSGISSSSKLTSLGLAVGKEINFTLSNGTTDSTVSLVVNDTSTVQDLINQVNSKTGGSVSMSIESTTGKVILKSKDSGSTTNLKILYSDTDTMNKIGLGSISSASGKINGNSLNSQVSVTDVTKWSGAKLDFGSSGSITLDSVIADAAKDGNTIDDIVTNINSKISGSSLKDKITASYVQDGANKYIKFTNLGTDSISLEANDTLGNLKTAINPARSSTSKLADLGFSVVAGANTIDFNLSDGSTTKKISLTVTASSTIQDLMTLVNTGTTGFNMDIDSDGKIKFNSTTTSSGLSITDNKGNLGNLKLTASATGTDALVDITEPGQTVSTTTTQSSNNFTANGVTYNMSKIGNSALTVTSNSDTVVSNVKKFVDDYNTVISKINTKLTEKKDKAYPPLTDAQKTSMSESQITTWETKAKVGILRKDDYLSSLMTQLRGTLYSPVYSSYSSTDASAGKIALNFGAYGTGSIGIETSTTTTDGGKLVIKDETKLKNAIENNMDDFKKLFIGTSTDKLATNEPYIGSKKYNQEGIFSRMNSIMKDYVAGPGLGKDGTYTLSGYMNIFVNKQYDYSSSGTGGKNTLPDQVYAKTQNVSKFQAQLTAASTRYYARFTALETAMNKLNSQQSSLTSMLGSSS